MKWIMDRTGILPALIVSKLIICTIMGAAVYFYPSLYLKIALVCLILVYVGVVLNNYKLSKEA